MSDRRILFIVEGQNDEPRFIQRLLNICYPKQEYKTYSYRTNIHVLAKHLKDDYPDFENEDIDIQLVLRQYESNEEQRKLLSERYTDIFLIFDFEPQEQKPSFDMIARMLLYFNDSTNRGKLFINYPMMQSYKHFPRLPYPEFIDAAVTLDECKEYKALVSSISKFTDIGKYNYSTFMSLASHHLCKANYIIAGCFGLPKKDDYLNWELSIVFKKQIESLSNNGIILVLNTCIFVLCDYQPESFFRQLSDSNRYLM